jgi:K(+)-stimulated pyrophosphate-energized sodium pump
MNPVIKFTTLFGLLAVELAVALAAEGSTAINRTLAALFFTASLVFVWRSFYGMRIGVEGGIVEGSVALRPATGSR